MTTEWHQITATPEGDNECERCSCVISDEALLGFSLPCPAPDCTSSKNPDRGCVFVPTRSGVSRCIFCGTPGSREAAAEQPDEDDDQFADEDDDVYAAT